MQLKEASGTPSSTLLGVLAVAVAAIVQVSVTPGPFDLWNVMAGSILIFLLSSYRGIGQLSNWELAALATTWGLVIVITAGVVIQWLLPNAPRTAKGELRPEYVFPFWITFSLIAGAFAYWRRRAARKRI